MEYAVVYYTKCDRDSTAEDLILYTVGKYYVFGWINAINNQKMCPEEIIFESSEILSYGKAQNICTTF